MCGWVINIVSYYRIYEVVEPKRQLLLAANVKLDDANTMLIQVSTRKPEPGSRNPKPETRNLKPETRNQTRSFERV